MVASLASLKHTTREVQMKKSKLVYGVGINDADCPTQPVINGKKVKCPFYQTWSNMLRRCYHQKEQERYPTYKGCSVCNEWLVFSNFKSWMDSQYWYMMQLDKDLLVKGNKIYSPETCVFVSGQLNSFTTESSSTRGCYPIGVNFHRSTGELQAKCRNPFTGKQEFLGYFNCANEAHEAWRRRKHELACQWAEIVEDPRLKEALRNRYKPH